MAYNRKIAIPEDWDFSLFDEQNPNSLVNRCPPILVEALQIAKQRLHDTFMYDAQQLKQFLGPFDERDDRLRINFWDEYNKCIELGIPKVRIKNVFSGGCVNPEVFRHVYMKSDKKLCWIFTAPTSYVAAMKQILDKGQERLLEIMSLPLKDENGKVNTALIGNILRTFQMVDLRLKGAIMQRVQIDQRTMNVNTDVSIEKMAEMQIDALKHMNVEELEILERKLHSAEKIVQKNVAALPDHLKQEVVEVMEMLPKQKFGDEIEDVSEIPELPSVTSGH